MIQISINEKFLFVDSYFVVVVLEPNPTQKLGNPKVTSGSVLRGSFLVVL